MSKKNEMKVIQFKQETLEPLFVAGRDVPKLIVGLSAKTLANWRYQKKGPPYYVIKGIPYYRWSELKEFFSQGRVETFNTDEE